MGAGAAQRSRRLLAAPMPRTEGTSTRLSALAVSELWSCPRHGPALLPSAGHRLGRPVAVDRGQDTAQRPGMGLEHSPACWRLLAVPMAWTEVANTCPGALPLPRPWSCPAWPCAAPWRWTPPGGFLWAVDRGSALVWFYAAAWENCVLVRDARTNPQALADLGGKVMPCIVEREGKGPAWGFM